jgi:hypothetical protein
MRNNSQKERFTRIFGQDIAAIPGVKLTVETKDLMIHISDKIKTSNLLMWTLTLQNVLWTSQEIGTYNATDAISAMQYVSQTYPKVDRDMKIEFVDNELRFIKKVA